MCAANGKTTDTTLSSRICVDDVETTSYTLSSMNVTIDDVGMKTIVRAYDPVVLSYYKIECDETVKFTNLPARTSVHVSSSLTATL